MNSIFHSCNEQLDELQKIVDSFIIISEKEKSELLDSAYSLICDSVISEPMLYIQPSFHDTIIANTCELLKHQLGDIFTGSIDNVIEKIAEEAMTMFYEKNAPRRSYKNTFIRKQCNKDRMTEKIEYLKSVPQPEQRTTAWYEFRQKVLTASNIWKIFSTQSMRNQLIYEKCCPFDKSKYENFGTNTESPMHWGQKYEPVSVIYYNMTYNTTIGDFGCIPHKTYGKIAASPDGINIMKESDRYGRMLEIKNIVNRIIDGVPKLEYWVQMQIQMEVCNLSECDFLETRFVEYENEDAFYADDKSNYARGMIMCFGNEGRPVYKYSPWGLTTKDELELWEQSLLDKHSDMLWIKNIYWKLAEVSCVLVLRNKLWFNCAKPMIDEFCKIIETEKENGEYKKREPKKRMKTELVTVNKCLFNFNELNTVYEAEPEPEPVAEPEPEPDHDVDVESVLEAEQKVE
jgi:putative phage-type endonuclease